MKKIYALVFATLCFTLSISASSIENPPVKASEVMVPVGNTGKSISLQDLSTISVKDFEDLSGSKMKGADKLLFKTAQKKIRKSINADGTLDNKQLERMYRKSGGGDGDFNIGGFALGFLLGLIGVLMNGLQRGGQLSQAIQCPFEGFSKLGKLLQRGVHRIGTVRFLSIQGRSTRRSMSVAGSGMASIAIATAVSVSIASACA